MNESKFSSAIIVGIALVVSALAFGIFYYSGQMVSSKDALSVTGSAKTRVTSDQAKLVLALTRTVTRQTLSSGYEVIAKDVSATRVFLKQAGIPDETITESTVSMNQMYKPNGDMNEFELRQIVTVQSDDVQKITDISKTISSLTSQGVFLSIQSLEYYYSKLPDLRVSLLSDAIKDAKARAEKIAQGTGREVGSVQVASSGVVQVLTPNSVEVSDYGAYDTSSIEKDIMVTVKASFRLR
jgi:hypothetical protein